MADLPQLVFNRFLDLLEAPLVDQKMLWAAVPLVIATLFITLYFGKYKQEELGWNTAFGNTMVFLFVSINLIQYMYYSSGTGSWDNVLSNNIYLSSTIALMAAGLMLMAVTYYHLLPRKVAFFLFSAPPINVSVYVIMTMIYASVPADPVTLLAALLLFLLIFAFLKSLQALERMSSSPEGIVLPKQEEKLLEKMKEKNIKLAEKKKKEEKPEAWGEEEPPKSA